MSIEEDDCKEATMVKRLRGGDEHSFNFFFTKYSRRLFTFAHGYLKSQEESEEIVQETFVRLWTNKHNLDDEKSFNGYIFSISYRLILNKIRDRQRESARREMYIYQCADECEVIEQDYFHKELEQLIQVAVAALPPRRKAIYEMSRQHNMSHQEIADSLNLSKKTIEVQITEALRYLKKVLKVNGNWISFFLLIYKTYLFS